MVETKTIKLKRTIEPPNEDEMAWIAENLDEARSLAARYAPQAGGDLDPLRLDRALTGWSISRDPTQRVEPNALVNALGLAFGQYLVDRLGMSWAVVSDEQGTDIAVHSSPGDILIFPTSAAAKRVEGGEFLFFEDLYRQMAADIGRIRRGVN